MWKKYWAYFWNIFSSLPKFFDVQEQPELTLENFEECVNSAFARLPETIRDASSYVYLGSDRLRCNYVTGKHKILAEKVHAVYLEIVNAQFIVDKSNGWRLFLHLW